ncbi:MAG: DUF6174 domain-containing protein [Flavobacteriaceae bacterium]|nr:DUF6174 domain-containing protein [Flavobacteriaceae bacterium]MDG1920667.1 DUF6174 domain-containing protein [Flavobacteriaceae bacterium]
MLLTFSCIKNTEVLPEEELSVEEQKWRDQNLESYEFTLQISCFCIREYTLPKRVVVQNNEVVQVDDTPYEKLNDSAIQTIDGYFDFIRETRKQNPDEEEITYDTDLGYPTYIFFDISYQMADEEIRYTISELIPSI